MPVTDDVVPQKFDLRKMKVTPASNEVPSKFDLSKIKVNRLDESEDKPQGSAVGRFISSGETAIGGAAKGLYHGVADEPQTDEEKRIVAASGNPITGRAALIAYRLGVAPAIEQGKEAASEFKQSNPLSLHPTQDQIWHRERALGHGLAAVIPGVGPWAAQVGEKVGQQISSSDVAGGAGTLAGNAALYAAPHVVRGVAAALIPKDVRNVLGPEPARDLVEKTRKANEEAAKANKTEVGKTRVSNQETREKYQKELADIQAHNERVKAKHEETAKQIQEERDAAEHALNLRRDEEAKLQQETQDYYAKEDAVDAKTRADANAKWNPVHQSLDDKTIDGGDIEKPLTKIIEISPDVRREINQLVPDPADADPESDYGKERLRVMESSGYPKGTNYFDLPLAKRIDIDKMTASSGFTPDPIDFDPKVGVGIPFDKVHRAQSIIGRNIRNGRYGYEGPLLGEMKQLQKILHDAESKIAADNGKTTELNEARQATREYQEAFGRARNIPKDQSELRKQQANPEQFREDNEQERVDAAKKHDPTLAEDYEKVKAHRQAIKKMKTEDQLRGSLKPVPLPPTVGDLREGYNLKEPSKAPVYTRRDENGQLFMLDPDTNSWVQAPEVGIKYQLEHDPTAEITKVGLEELQKAKQEAIHKGAKWIRYRGRWIATSAIIGSTLYQVLRGNLSYAGEEVLGGLAAFAITGKIADFLEKPETMKWLAKPTAEDIQELRKLPPEQKTELANALAPAIKEAEAQGITINPIISSFVTAGAAQQPQTKSLDDVKKEGEDRQKGAQIKDTVGPQSSAKPVSPEDVKAQAEQLQSQFYKGGFSLESAPRGSAKPYHYVYDESKDTLVPA